MKPKKEKNQGTRNVLTWFVIAFLGLYILGSFMIIKYAPSEVDGHRHGSFKIPDAVYNDSLRLAYNILNFFAILVERRQWLRNNKYLITYQNPINLNRSINGKKRWICWKRD
jgi:hypothetical protein